MAGLILPKRFRRQPQYAAPLNANEPLRKRLIFAFNAAVPDLNLVSNQQGTDVSNGISRNTCSAGRSISKAPSGSFHGRYWTATTSGQQYTVAIFLKDGGANHGVAYQQPISVGTPTAVFFLRLYPDSTIGFRTYDTTGATVEAGGPAPVSGTEYSLIICTLGADKVPLVYLNGVAGSNPGAHVGTPRDLAASRIMLVQDDVFNGELFDGDIVGAYCFDCGVTAAEAKRITESFWRFYKYPRRAWVDLGAASGGATYNDSASDSATATDAATQQLTAPAAAADAATATDSATNLGVLVRSASDAAAASDSASNALTIAASTTDAASATDSTTSASAVNSAATDAITATDAATQLAVLPAAVSDAIAAADVASNVATMAAAATDAVAATDSVTGLRITTAAATDAATATDSASQVNAVNVAATDAISAADAATVQAVLAGIVSDGFSAVDAATLLAGIYNVTAADVLSLLDLAAADGGVQYTRAPAGWAQPLIEPTGHRAPVISGSRPGNINTSRPANRGGRRT